MDNLNEIVANNLSYLRKAKGLTQQQLADQLNYSDKTISKWELGYAVPSMEVLIELSNFYEVPLDYLIKENDPKKLKRYDIVENQTNKIIITALGATAIWAVAAVIFCFFVFDTSITFNAWIVFCWALVISLLESVFMVRFFWGGRHPAFFILLSLFLWSLIATFYLQFLNLNLWYMFFVGVPLQIAIILWSQLK